MMMLNRNMDGRLAPLSTEALDRQTALAEARMVLGVIDILENLDGRDEPLEQQLTQLERWLDQPAGMQLSEQNLGGLLQ